MTAVDQVLRFLGEVVLYGGGSAAVAYLLFQYLGKGWIDARFAELPSDKDAFLRALEIHRSAAE